MYTMTEMSLKLSSIDSEINVLFLLNKHGDLHVYFLLLNNSVCTIFFYLKEFKKI